MQTSKKRWAVDDLEQSAIRWDSGSSAERQAELAMFRLLLTSMKKRHAWDRIKCAIATGIPAFWTLMIVLGPIFPAAIATSVPSWLAAQVQPALENIPAIWTVGVSLAIAGFQWYNLAYYQRRVIPLVRNMYARALTRRDPELLTMLGEALRFRSLRASFRAFLRKLFSMSR